MQDSYLSKLRSSSVYKELPQNYIALLEDFYKELKAAQLASGTIRNFWSKIIKFLHFLCKININNITEVSADILNTYLHSAFNSVNLFGVKSSSKYSAYYIYALRRFFNSLEEKGIINNNPAIKLVAPRRESPLPRSVLSKEEVMRILDIPDTTTLQGLKARAILELFYGCGIRNGELKNLKVSDVDLKKGLLFVDKGKGKKDRQIPIGKSAAYWLERYSNIRNSLSPKVPYFFLALGEKTRLSSHAIWTLVKRTKKKAGIAKPVYPHTLRHCFATHLLEEGAPLEAISAMLGHVSIETTRIYTHVAIGKLKELHQKYHPREKMKP